MYTLGAGDRVKIVNSRLGHLGIDKGTGGVIKNLSLSGGSAYVLWDKGPADRCWWIDIHHIVKEEHMELKTTKEKVLSEFHATGNAEVKKALKRLFPEVLNPEWVNITDEVVVKLHKHLDFVNIHLEYKDRLIAYTNGRVINLFDMFQTSFKIDFITDGIRDPVFKVWKKAGYLD